MSQPKGFLLAVMEPPPPLTEEFNEWYDTEHLPQREAIKGFHTALRYICTEGWPRFLAIYDLETVRVLDVPEYRAVAGENFSPWSRRVLTKVSGQWRFSGNQVFPGTAITGDQGAPASVLLVRWRGAKAQWRDAIINGMRESFEQQPGVLQVRVFVTEGTDPVDYVGIVEATTPPSRNDLDLPAFGEAAKGIDLVNLYSPYWRRGTAHAIYK